MIPSSLSWGSRLFWMMLSLCAFSSLLDVSRAWAQNLNNAPVIFDVRRSLPLDPDEPVFHDFYINAGPEAGFRKGVYVSVVRQVPVHDPVQNTQQATLNVTVGKLQIIHVERGIAVGRLHSELGDDERPTLEFEAVMVGDRVDPSSATSEAPKVKPKMKAKKPVAVAPSPATGSVATTAPTVTTAAAAAAVVTAAPANATSLASSSVSPAGESRQGGSPKPSSAAAPAQVPAPASAPAPASVPTSAPASGPAPLTVPVPAPSSGAKNTFPSSMRPDTVRRFVRASSISKQALSEDEDREQERNRRGSVFSPQGHSTPASV